MKKVIVVGGGFSGMVTAYFLSRKGFAVELHESGSRLGGLISTEHISGSGPVESAANGFILTEDLVSLLEELGLDYIETQKSARKRFIFRGKLRRWPLGILETVDLLGRVLSRFLFQRSSFRPQSEESVWGWGLRCLNRAMTQYLLAPALQGIYAGDAHRMSAELVLGPLFKRKATKKKSKYRGTISFKNGMGEFVSALERKLRDQGVRVELNSHYQIKDLSIPHVVCVSAAVAPKIIAPVAPEAAELLSRVEVLPVLRTTVFFEKPRFKLVGFGALFPEDQQYRVLGILSNTYIFENRGPLYNESWIFGGAHSPEMLNKSNDEILAQIQSERTRIFGATDKIVDYRIHPWPQALPHYTLEHQKILKELKLPRNLYLNGNYMGAIGLSKMLVYSQELVNEFS